jgi:hypothetical protein
MEEPSILGCNTGYVQIFEHLSLDLLSKPCESATNRILTQGINACIPDSHIFRHGHTWEVEEPRDCVLLTLTFTSRKV